jgi:hypothetical protein
MSSDPRDEWPADWAAVTCAQRRDWAALTPAERLAWLEDALTFAHQVGALPRRAEAPRDGPDAPD